MISKFLRSGVRSKHLVSTYKPMVYPQTISVRAIFGLIPPNQYDMPGSKKFKLGYVLKTHWDIIPLFVTTAVAMSALLGSIIWACNHKVDVVYTSRNRDNISRTMDLRNPTTHKLFLIHQRYEPWPEMQDVLDKMVIAEKRALTRMQSCSHG